MPRISGVDIPAEKKTVIALTYIYGIGKKNVYKVLHKAGVDIHKRVKELTEKEIVNIQKAIEDIPTEGILRKMVQENIKRLKQIKAYRGLRHSAKLPVRGQRTRHNARTKRGKRLTVGALKKEMLHKLEAAKKKKE